MSAPFLPNEKKKKTKEPQHKHLPKLPKIQIAHKIYFSKAKIDTTLVRQYQADYKGYCISRSLLFDIYKEFTKEDCDLFSLVGSGGAHRRRMFDEKEEAALLRLFLIYAEEDENRTIRDCWQLICREIDRKPSYSWFIKFVRRSNM